MSRRHLVFWFALVCIVASASGSAGASVAAGTRSVTHISGSLQQLCGPPVVRLRVENVPEDVLGAFPGTVGQGTLGLRKQPLDQQRERVTRRPITAAPTIGHRLPST